MKIGSLVECINDNYMWDYYPVGKVHKGNIYTIRDIGFHLYKGEGGNHVGAPIIFEEIVNPIAPSGGEWHYDSSDFREIQPPMEIKIESLISEPQTV